MVTAPPPTLPPSLVREWLVAFLAQPGLQHELKDVAAFGALPLYWDVGGCMALTVDGRVLAVYWDKPGQSFVEAEPRFRIAALVAGLETHPELRALLPARPEGAPPCHNCDGQGHLDDGGLCGVCGGLGFLSSALSG
jgi:hypothetical protein